MSDIQELENETTPRFELATQNALQGTSGLQGQGRIAGFSSAVAGFVLDTGPSHGLIDVYRLNDLAHINAGVYALHNVGIGSSITAGALTVGVSSAVSSNPLFAPAPTMSHWGGGRTEPRLIATSTAETATTITVSTLFDPGPNTSTASLLRDATCDPLTGYNRYSVPNWDGYGAEAITPATIAAARQFIRDLPKTFGEPDIAPGADGTIGLEWSFRNGPLRKLFIDIGPGSQWSSYWRRALGDSRTLPSVAITPATRIFLQALFKALNS